MATRIDCPHCGSPLQVLDQVLGKKVRCPRCQAVIATAAAAVRVPPAPPPMDALQQGISLSAPRQPKDLYEPEPLAPAPAASPEARQPEDESRPARRKRSRRRTKPRGFFARLGLPAIAVENGVMRIAVAIVVAVLVG